MRFHNSFITECIQENLLSSLNITASVINYTPIKTASELTDSLQTS